MGKEAGYDYVFVGEPMIATRGARRSAWCLCSSTRFGPTMSLYGYETYVGGHRPNANEGAVFSNARSIAPWTLPSARTVITSRRPEFYDTSEALPTSFVRRLRDGDVRWKRLPPIANDEGLGYTRSTCGRARRT